MKCVSQGREMCFPASKLISTHIKYTFFIANIFSVFIPVIKITEIVSFAFTFSVEIYRKLKIAVSPLFLYHCSNRDFVSNQDRQV